jgi:hypothetical protein
MCVFPSRIAGAVLCDSIICDGEAVCFQLALPRSTSCLPSPNPELIANRSRWLLVTSCSPAWGRYPRRLSFLEMFACMPLIAGRRYSMKTTIYGRTQLVSLWCVVLAAVTWQAHGQGTSANTPPVRTSPRVTTRTPPLTTPATSRFATQNPVLATPNPPFTTVAPPRVGINPPRFATPNAPFARVNPRVATSSPQVFRTPPMLPLQNPVVATPGPLFVTPVSPTVTSESETIPAVPEPSSMLPIEPLVPVP